MRSIFSVFVFSALTFGCATPYQEMGFRGGVSSTQVNDSVYEINARGNGMTSSTRVRELSLLRAADICQANGFTNFVVLDDSASQTTSVQSYDLSVIDSTCYGSNISCYQSPSGISSVTRHRKNMVVKMYIAEESPPDTSYSCAMIFKSLGAKYID